MQFASVMCLCANNFYGSGSGSGSGNGVFMLTADAAGLAKSMSTGCSWANAVRAGISSKEKPLKQLHAVNFRAQ